MLLSLFLSVLLPNVLDENNGDFENCPKNWCCIFIEHFQRKKMITISWQNVDTQQKRWENSEDSQEEKQKSITIICWDQLHTLDQQVELEIETAPIC